MREIKFRAWNIKQNRWANHNELLGTIPANATVNSPSKLTCGSDDYEIQMYTGLKDKHGKEIYEGDIIKIYHYNDTLHLIRWNEDMLFYDVIRRSTRVFMLSTLFSSEQELEIIGNIYENPELLEEST